MLRLSNYASVHHNSLERCTVKSPYLRDRYMYMQHLQQNIVTLDADRMFSTLSLGGGKEAHVYTNFQIFSLQRIVEINFHVFWRYKYIRVYF